MRVSAGARGPSRNGGNIHVHTETCARASDEVTQATSGCTIVEQRLLRRVEESDKFALHAASNSRRDAVGLARKRLVSSRSILRRRLRPQNRTSLVFVVDNGLPPCGGSLSGRNLNQQYEP